MDKKPVNQIRDELNPVLAGLHPDIQAELSTVFDLAEKSQTATAVFVEFQRAVGDALTKAVGQLRGEVPLALSDGSHSNRRLLPASKRESDGSVMEEMFMAVVRILQKGPIQSRDLRQQIAPNDLGCFRALMSKLRKLDFVSIEPGTTKQYAMYKLTGDPDLISFEKLHIRKKRRGKRRGKNPKKVQIAEPRNSREDVHEEVQRLIKAIPKALSSGPLYSSELIDAVNADRNNRYSFTAAQRHLIQKGIIKKSGHAGGARYANTKKRKK